MSDKVTADDTLISWGGAVKALGDGKIGGYLVRFTGPDERDLEWEYFTDKTYLGPRDGHGADCLVHHGMTLKDGLEGLAEHWLRPIETKRDDVGLWAETILNMADEYEAMIHEMVEADKLGWSSATAGHMRHVTSDGEITRWPIIEGSLTPMPAEPRNRAIPLKAYMAELEPTAQAETPQGAPTKDAPAPAAESKAKPKLTQQEMIMKFDIIKVGDFYHVYAMSDEGKTEAHPRFSAKDREACEKYIEDQGKPDWLRYAERAQEASDKRMETMLKAFVAGQASTERGGYATAPATTETGKTFFDFIKAITLNDLKTLTEMGSTYEKFSEKVLGDQTGAAGGFTVPTQFIPDLIRFEAESEIVWPRARRIDMTARSVQVPGLSTAGSTAGQSNFFGGVWPLWTEVGTEKPETEPEFTQIELVAHELSGYLEIKDNLLRDSAISMDPLIRDLFRDSLMYITDEAFLDGTGVGMPQGVITANGTYVHPRQTAGAISYEDAKNMYMHLVAQSQGNAIWVINQMCMAEIMDWEDTAGNLIWQPNAREGVPQRIFGRPIFWTEKVPTLGRQGDIGLFDFSRYYLGLNTAVTIGVSEHYRFRYNRTAYRCVIKVDGQEMLNEPIYLKDGTEQVSPFVVLGAAAT